MDATRICLGRFRNLLSSLFRFSLVVLVVIHPGRGEGAESSAVRDWKGGRRFGSQWVAAGDEVRDRDGVHHYQRSAAWVAIRPVPGRSAEEALRGWMDSVGGLDGCELGITIAQGFTLVRLSQVVCQDLLNQPASLQGLLDEARASGWIEAANPVLREEGSKTGLIATEEMVICLSQEVNPRSYFGSSWDRVKRVSGTTNQYVLRHTSSHSEEVLKEVSSRTQDPRVLWAEPNFLTEALHHTADPLYPLQWHLYNSGVNGMRDRADINALEAWATGGGSADTVVAVLDDGFDLQNPDLRDRYFRNPGETVNGLDEDGNGYPDDVTGWNFDLNDNDPSPHYEDEDHGTATAGMAVATANNGLGGTAVAYGCSLLPVRFAGPFYTASHAASAIYYAAGLNEDGVGRWRGADVISLSFSLGHSFSIDSAISWAVRHGRQERGTPVFVSSGNSGSKWSNVRLPVGRVLGPGIYRFAFEYAKDSIDGLSVGEDLAKVDNVALLGSDGWTILNTALGPNGRQDFESATFPPSGWTVASSPGAASWRATTVGVLTGTGGSRSARSGTITHRQWTQLRTPYLNLSGNETLKFGYYISSEGINGFGFDGLRVQVYDETGFNVYTFDDPQNPGDPLFSGDPEVVDGIDYPASHPDAISVGASTDVDLRSDYSQYGSNLDLVAPSSGGWHNVVTTDRSGDAGLTSTDYNPGFNGTSASCPLAAGVGALVLAARPSLGAADVRALMRSSADPIGSVVYTKGFNSLYGYGRVNAGRAISRLNSVVMDLQRMPLRVSQGQEVVLSASITNRNAFTLPAVTVTNFFPSEGIWISSEQSAGTSSRSGNRVVFELGALPPGAGAEVSVHFRPLGDGTLSSSFTLATNHTWMYAISRSFQSASPEVRIADVIVPEGNDPAGVISFPVSLSNPSGLPVSVHYETFDLSANQEDFYPTNGVITFLPGETNQVVQVIIRGDGLYEEDETLEVVLSFPSNAVLGRGFALGTLLNDDFPPTISIAGTAVWEGGSGSNLAVFPVTLSTSSAKEVAAHWEAVGGTAVSGEDFVPSTGAIRFPAGEVKGQIEIPVLGDLKVEPNERFTVVLSAPENATIAVDRAEGFILNDDGPQMDLDHFSFSPIGPIQYPLRPFPLKITALDPFGGVVTNFNANVTLALVSGRSLFFSNDFEASLGSVVLSNDFGKGRGLWHLSRGRRAQQGHSGDSSLYYGKGESATRGGNYDTGSTAANEGVAIIPEIDLRGVEGAVQLSFHTLIDVETAIAKDLATVDLSIDHGATWIRLAGAGDAKFSWPKNSAGKWIPITIDLTAYVGKTIFLRWHFNSVDPFSNATEGWFVDDIVVQATAKLPVLDRSTAGPFVQGSWTGFTSVSGVIRGGEVLARIDGGFEAMSNPFEVLALVDANGNGLPDDWERGAGFLEGAGVDPQGDPDGDGFSNAAEFAAGTLPNDPSSSLTIQRIKQEGSGTQLQFQSVIGHLYQVETASTLTPPDWTAVGEPLLGDGTLLHWTASGSGDPRGGYYRIRLVLAQ